MARVLRSLLGLGLAMGLAEGAADQPTAAQLRRWEGSTDCTGAYAVLSTDRLGECTPYLVPEPASIRVEYLNETTYASYHFDKVLDCSGAQKRHLGDFVVGACEDLGGYSQMRVWLSGPSPRPGQCAERGYCGKAYAACCLASRVKGTPCACALRNGTGEAGSPDCGLCGQAFVACCAGFRLRGAPCSCDVGATTAIVI